MMAKGKWRGGRPTAVRGVSSLGHGQYRLRVYVQDPVTGREKERERIVLAASVAEAADLRAAMEAELRGVAVASTGPAPTFGPSRTVADVARDWLKLRLSQRRKDGSPRLTPNTRERYTHAIERVIVPTLGERPIEGLDRRTIEAWRDWLGERYASSTVNPWLVMLRAILGDAGIEVGKRVEGLRVDDTRITEDAPNLIEDPKTLAVFLAKVREEEPQHLAFIGTLVTTGLRMSTALALRREDFEPERGVIVARRRISANEIVEGVKRSRTARDVVPLVEWVWEAVRAEWAGHNEKQRGSGLAFPSATGGFRARSHLDKPIDRIAAELKIPRLTPHGLRRTAALLYRRELGSAVSMAIAGHLTEEMHRHYAPVGVAERSAAGQTVFGALRGQNRPETGGTTGGAGILEANTRSG